jgi:hypothetical protein
MNEWKTELRIENWELRIDEEMSRSPILNSQFSILNSVFEGEPR